MSNRSGHVAMEHNTDICIIKLYQKPYNPFIYKLNELLIKQKEYYEKK